MSRQPIAVELDAPVMQQRANNMHVLFKMTQDGIELDPEAQVAYDNPQILRVPLMVSDDRQSFLLPATCPEGTKVVLMQRDEQYIFAGVDRLMDRMVGELDGRRRVRHDFSRAAEVVQHAPFAVRPLAAVVDDRHCHPGEAHGRRQVAAAKRLAGSTSDVARKFRRVHFRQPQHAPQGNGRLIAGGRLPRAGIEINNCELSSEARDKSMGAGVMINAAAAPSMRDCRTAASRYPAVSGLRQVVSASPRQRARTLSTAMLPIAVRVSRLAEAMCGTMTTLSIFASSGSIAGSRS